MNCRFRKNSRFDDAQALMVADCNRSRALDGVVLDRSMRAGEGQMFFLAHVRCETPPARWPSYAWMSSSRVARKCSRNRSASLTVNSHVATTSGRTARPRWLSGVSLTPETGVSSTIANKLGLDRHHHSGLWLPCWADLGGLRSGDL